MLKLPDKPRLESEELKKAKANMRDLRAKGFTNKEVSQLTRGRWSEATVKKYTRGVKVKSTVERDKVIDMITELTLAGKSKQDIEDYLQFNRVLNTQDSSLQALAKFYYDSLSKNINVLGLTRLHSELETSVRSLEQLNADLDRVESLISQDLTTENMLLIHQTSENYGGFEKTMQALQKYSDFGQLNQLYLQTMINYNNTIQKNQDLINENVRLETQNKVLGAYAATAQTLVIEGYDLASLSALKKLVDKYGGPVVLFDAIGEYEGVDAIRQVKANLTQINKELDAKRVEKVAILAEKEFFIEEADKKIGAIEANQAKAVAAQIIFELMTGPESLDIEPSKFKRIVLFFLLGTRQYADRNKDKIDGWKTIENSLKWLIDGLTKIT